MFRNLLDNRYYSILFLPFAIWNTISSYRLMKKELNLLIEIINSNDDFFKALGTLGFYPSKNRLYFETNLKVDEHLGNEEVSKIANTTIIAVIMNYVKNESLLGVVNVDCGFKKKDEVKVILRPSTLKLFYNDCFDLCISLLIYLIALFTFLIIF